MKRFWSKVDREHPSGCWLWLASKRGDGYGQFWLDGKMPAAHRVAYELTRGPILVGMQLDHLCRVRACVNPDHLEVVTQQENIRRGQGGKWHRAKTHCPQGHPYDEVNTRWTRNKRGGWIRNCRECNRACVRRRRARLKARNG